MSGNKEKLQQTLDALKKGQQGPPRRADAVAAETLGISESQAKKLVDELRDQGLVQRGRGRNATYTLITNSKQKEAADQKPRARRTMQQRLSNRQIRTEVTTLLLREPVKRGRRELSLTHLAAALGIEAERIRAAVREVKANGVLGTRTAKGELVVWLAHPSK